MTSRPDASAPPVVPEVVEGEASALPTLEEIVEASTAAHAEALRAAPQPVPALRVARLIAIDGRRATVAWRGLTASVAAEIAPEVEREVVERALADKEAVLVEVADGQAPLVVGVLATRLPREVHVHAETIHIEAEREVLLRAGRAALRLRADGDVELVGSRISAASRGLFRLVGRILRLN